MVLVLNRKGINKMLYATVFFMFIMGFLIHNLGLPIGLMAILDAVVVLSLLFAACFFETCLSKTQAGTIIIISAAMLVVGIVNALWQRVSPSLILDGMRNSFRGMVTFCVAVCLLQKGTVDKIIQLMERFFRINVVVCTIQAFLLGVSHDNCNGLFGAGKMNSWTNILLCVMAIYYISRYINHLISLRYMAVNIVLCLYIAMLAELKFFFFELVIIAMLLVLLTKPSWRTFSFCLIGGILMMCMLAVFIAFWEDDSMFTVEGIKYYLDPDRSYGYSTQGDWGRIGGIAKATKKFFAEDLNLFGMGLGYCGFDTPFYYRYELLHYNWFSYISIFLEQGWVGIIGYIAFFVVNILKLYKKKKMVESPEAKTVFDISLGMSVLGIVLLFYNSTITGYPAFFLFLLIGMAYRYDLGEEMPKAKKKLEKPTGE